MSGKFSTLQHSSITAVLGQTLQEKPQTHSNPPPLPSFPPATDEKGSVAVLLSGTEEQKTRRPGDEAETWWNHLTVVCYLPYAHTACNSKWTAPPGSLGLGPLEFACKNKYVMVIEVL